MIRSRNQIPLTWPAVRLLPRSRYWPIAREKTPKTLLLELCLSEGLRISSPKLCRPRKVWGNGQPHLRSRPAVTSTSTFQMRNRARHGLDLSRMRPSELLMRLMHRHHSPTITPPARVRCREGAMPSRTNKRLLRVNRWVKRGSLGVPGSACGGTEGGTGVIARCLISDRA